MQQVNYFTLFLALLFLAAGCTKQMERPEIVQHQPSFKRIKIVIDAGHGGKDLGALAQSLEEKVLNLSTALKLEAHLRAMGYETLLTRGADFFVPLDLRAAIANSNHADLFVSVHYNSAPNPKAEGVEVYYYDAEKNIKRTKESKILAEKVLDRIVQGTVCKSRGVKKGNFAVIRETTMPAILVEGGFVTNQNELIKLRTPVYLEAIADNIAQGIQDYFKEQR